MQIVDWKRRYDTYLCQEEVDHRPNRARAKAMQRVLRELGVNAMAIRRSLTELGIKGKPQDCSRCVLAQFAEAIGCPCAIFPGDKGGHFTVRFEGDYAADEKLPPSCNLLAISFDRRNLPELTEATCR